MHEASIVDGLLRMATGLASGRRVRRIHVRVGGFSGVSPEAMQFYFEALREDTVGPQAELEVERAPLKAGCQTCGKQVEVSEAAWLCPACGAASLAYQNGNELDLVAIEVEADGDDPDQGEDPGQERRAGRREPAAV